MADTPRTSKTASSSRRTFMKASTAAVFGGLALSRSAHAAGNDTIRIGLIGCGGRGSGAADNALNADANVKLVAMGDTFADRLQTSLANLSKRFPADKIDVPRERQFVGFDAYQKVIDSGVDVVLLATPPHFRPAHLKAAIAANKHVFAEKPVAVDAAGVRSVAETVEEARKKSLAIVSGLCWRYYQPKRDVMDRVHNGDLGEILAIHETYNTSTLKQFPRQDGWSDMEFQIRNWYHFNWLSGDHNVEQHVHSLDKAGWAMREESPVRATGLGGRQVRIEGKIGNNFDHHAVVYEYASGVKLFAYCRQQDGCSDETTDYIIGTQGTADVMGHSITGPKAWKYRGPSPDMYQVEHDELFKSIRSGQPINNGEYMTKSTMLAIMGRMATYTGKTITWDQAWNSSEVLGPAAYNWGELPIAPVATPGITQFA